MKVQDEITVKIEKLSNLGFGIAKHEGLVIFVKNACPEDELKVKITKLTKNYANAQIVEILTPSTHRVTPFCALQKVCGGCQLQFIDYEYQLKLKKEIVSETVKMISGVDIEVKDVVASPQNKNYRHKVQYPIAQTKVSERILAGYYKPKSHEIINIKHCPIQPEICDSIIEFVRNNASKYTVSGYTEKKHTGDLRHVVLRISKSTGKILVTLVVNSTKSFDKLKDFTKNIFDNFKDVTGVCANFNSKKTNVILGENTELLEGKEFIEEKILDKTFKIGPKTFFQVNPSSAENIFAFVKNYIKDNFENPSVLDAYAGVTAFGIVVSDVCKKVVSVEESKEAVGFATEAIKLNNIKNVELHNMDAQKFFKKVTESLSRDETYESVTARQGTDNSKSIEGTKQSPSKTDNRFDAVILDPPRKGCTQESLDYALKLCKGKIIYISCNPATLARDLKYLTKKGAKAEFIQPFDMFCHTYHVESVAIININ